MAKWRLKRGYGSHVELDMYTRQSTSSIKIVLCILAVSVTSFVISTVFTTDLVNINDQQQESHVQP